MPKLTIIPLSPNYGVKNVHMCSRVVEHVSIGMPSMSDSCDNRCT